MPPSDWPMLSAAFFDLDGTLADTAPDLAAALNQVCREQGKKELSFDAIRPVVSNGGNALIKFAFNITEDSDEFSVLRDRFLEVYNARLHNSTTLFPGMEAVLNYLEKNGYHWGVVTNKPSWLTDPLMARLGLEKRAICIISGDTTPYRKPHPGPLFLACEIAGCKPPDSVYIGDAERDIRAGIDAGMHTLVARYGYIEINQDPSAWGADAMIDRPDEIISWLKSHNNK